MQADSEEGGVSAEVKQRQPLPQPTPPWGCLRRGVGLVCGARPPYMLADGRGDGFAHGGGLLAEAAGGGGGAGGAETRRSWQ
jgi:hypothetical protein